jgi:broad specificity phosphatase PhoE
MKTVYFVRHGESEGNASGIYQAENSPLTELGLKQAESIAERCAKLPIDAIISSPLIRARQTAEKISARLGMEVEFSELFAERERPTEVKGKKHGDAAAIAMDRTWLQRSISKMTDPLYGETFDHVMDRARRALDLLDARTEEHLLVVTHGFFLRVILAEVLIGQDITPGQLERLIAGTRTRNTGITMIRQDSWLRGAKWCLHVYNDHAHLG